MSNQTNITFEINAKIEITIVKHEPKEEVKTPERKIHETIILPDVSKRRRIVKYPFDILNSDFE